MDRYFTMLRQLTELLTEILLFVDNEIRPNFDKFSVVNQVFIQDKDMIIDEGYSWLKSLLSKIQAI